MKTVRRPPYPKWNPGYFPCSSLTPLPLSSRRPSVSFGGFGLTQARNGLTSEPLGGLREITMATTGDRVVYAALPEAMEAVVIYAPGQPILAKIVAALGLGETAGP